MSIYKVSTNLPRQDQIEALNDMIMEVDGKVAQGKFDKNELDQIYADLGLERKFTRNYSLGNTLSSYADWTHVHAESGYSIWKYPLADYLYNANNQMFFDDKNLVFKGSATAETALTFDKVLLFDGSYTDDTTEAGTETGTEFSLIDATGEYLYLGYSTKFSGVKFEFQTRGSNHALKVEYYNGAWTELTTADNLEDTTEDFESNGTITWTSPAAWTTVAVDGTTKYWIRISTTTTPVAVAKAYYIIPFNSVISLLALSSSEVLAESWAWCSYGSYIYVTIRNTGADGYEGDFYLTSSCSTTNKQNFFIYNHEYKIDYRTSGYTGGPAAVESGVAVGNMVAVTDDYTFDNAIATMFARRAVGVMTSAGIIQYTGLATSVGTVGSGNIIAGDIVYLSITAGKVSRTAPSSAGQIQQKIGTAVSDERSGNVVDIILNIDYPTIL